MTNAIKVSKSDKAIKAIIRATFPEWKGRKVRVEVATTYSMENFWDGGSRCYVQAYSLEHARAAAPVAAASNPFRAQAHATVEIPAGVVMVEHHIFQGKDAGITIYVRPENLQAALPGASAAPELATA